MSGDESEPKEPEGEPVEVEAEIVETEIVESGADEKHELLPPVGADDGSSLQPLRMIERYRVSRLRSRKELEAMEIVLDSRLDEMRLAADAAKQQSQARWNARTADVVTALKTVVQAQLRTVENERMAARFESIEKAYETFAAKVREVETGPLPEELREDLVRKLREHLTATIERLESDAIAGEYDLKD